MAALQITPELVLPDGDLSWSAVRSSGPGGQNVNKVSTKVELRFNLRDTGALTESAKSRLVTAAGKRVDAQGWLTVTCDETRSQAQNLETARQKLAELVRSCLKAPRRRKATRPTRASNLRRLNDKSQASKRKAERRTRPE